MTPLEINKKIAELKGWKLEPEIYWHYKNIPQWKRPDGFVSYEDNGHAESMPMWAENISDAWELFEEIPGAVISKDDDNEDGCNNYYCRSATDNLSIYGATAPEAICLAWIKWKEGK